MSDKTTLKRDRRVDRRKFIGGLGAGVTAGIAGCGGGGGGGQDTTATTTEATTTSEDTTTQSESEDTTTEEEESSGPVTGGQPIEGMATAPNSLNVLSSSTAYAFEIFDQIYTYGTTLHPETLEFTPWGFTDWTLNPDNIGGSSPTLTGTLRDDLTWHDGNDVTAGDVKFTVEYIQEQEPAGSIAASQFASVESVEVDSEGGKTVNYFFSEKDNAWFTNVLGNVILPPQVWSDVSDYQKFTPRNVQGGLVGSGPMEVDDFSWENWFELTWREDGNIWENSAEYADWLHDDGPFTDGVRMEVFGSQNALQQAVINGDVDCSYGTFTIDSAVQAQQSDNVEVKQSDDDGWSHFSYNTRRVPLDDPAFRQLLTMMLDSTWIIDQLKQGIGAVKGTYATPIAYGEWRPPEPTETDEFEGISIPDLTFPGSQGSFQVGEDAVQAARDFLMNHPRAKHDYSLGEATTGSTAAPDSQEIYVNGSPLGEAHTDNDGNGGQGPLEHSFNPPQDDVDEARIAQRWVGALKKVGVPVESQVQSFNSQLPKVYADENFDMFAMGWTGIGVNNDHYSQFFSSEGADLDGTADAQLFNPMGYTNADDLIKEQAGMMAAEPRKPLVQQALARIWADSPTTILQYANILQPVNKRWTGWVSTVGGVVQTDTWLNLRQAQDGE